MAEPLESCKIDYDKSYVPRTDTPKQSWDLSTSECVNTLDNKMIEDLQIEQLNIAGAPINIFPLMGIHNQGSTIDLIGNGWPLSGGTRAGSNVLDGFTIGDAAWTSSQTGIAVLTAPAWIGYDFGHRLNQWGQTAYEPKVPVRHSVRTLRIQQSLNPNRRARQIRIEQSDDGVQWTRVEVANLADSPDVQIVKLRIAPAAGKWRIVPTVFAGDTLDEPWEVVSIQMLEATQTSLDDIQDPLLLENRDRHYNRTSIQMKCYYDIMDLTSDFARFGIEIPTQYMFTVSFLDMINHLGRPIVVGDLIELPSETQYDTNLRPIKRWLEVSDATWDTNSYTPTWRPTMFKFYASPVIPAAEHRDILGDTAEYKLRSDEAFKDRCGVVGVGDNLAVLSRINAIEAQTAVPEIGTNQTDQTILKDVQIGIDTDGNGIPDAHIAYNSPSQTALYVEDGLPPNGESYTEGHEYPPNPTDGDYHRLTYAKGNIPTRLYQWNMVKRKWLFVEQDNRSNYNSMRPSLRTAIKDGKK